MTVRKLLTAGLLLFVVVSLGVFVANEIGRRGTSSSQEGIAAAHAAPAEEATDLGGHVEAPSASAETAQTSEFVQETLEGMPASATVAEGGDRPEAVQVIAYYFHNTARCKTCLKIESTAREAMEEVFAADFASDRLVWRSLNMEKPENEHFAYEYDLAMPSLVLVLMEEETEVDWKRLDDTWTLIRDKRRFVTYVVEETEAYLGVYR